LIFSLLFLIGIESGLIPFSEAFSVLDTRIKSLNVPSSDASITLLLDAALAPVRNVESLSDFAMPKERACSNANDDLPVYVFHVRSMT
jgi:hypothetical protein